MTGKNGKAKQVLHLAEAKLNQAEALLQKAEQHKANLEKWRASQVHEMTLPSGLAVKVKKVTLTDLALSGRLPEPIMELAEQAEKEGKTVVDLKAGLRQVNDLGAFLDMITKLCLIEPPLADEPDDEHVTLAEISMDDKMAIFTFLNEEAEALRPFREGEDEPVEAALAGGGVRSATERNPGDPE